MQTFFFFIFSAKILLKYSKREGRGRSEIRSSVKIKINELKRSFNFNELMKLIMRGNQSLCPAVFFFIPFFLFFFQKFFFLSPSSPLHFHSPSLFLSLSLVCLSLYLSFFLLFIHSLF